MGLRFVFLFCITFCMLYANANIKDVSLPDFKVFQNVHKLYKGIGLQFGRNPARLILKKRGIIASKIGHRVFKDSEEVCLMLLFSALRDLQMQALQLGGTKIGNIESYLDGSSSRIVKYFQCKSGIVFNVVVLRADVY